MKRKVQLIVAFCFFSFNVQSQSKNIDEQLKFDKEFVVGSIKVSLRFIKSR